MRKQKLFLVFVVFALIFSSCRKPYQEEIYQEVQPQQTAFVIPLETGTKEKQSVMKSEQYLEANKVAAKRIYIPTQWHQEGRMGYTGKWIPSVRVILVDRTPVTREWTDEGNGTSGTKKEDIEVESKESIGFGIGITATGSIPEEWASRFLYNYNGRTLELVMDKDVRGYIQNILTSEFGIRMLSDCQADRKIIFDTMRVMTIKYFANMGVRIMNIGAAGGFNYIDVAIQNSINDKFASEMKIESATNEVAAANKFSLAASAIKKQKNLDADIRIKDAIADGIRSGKIPMPNTLVMGGQKMSLMDIYATQNLK